MKKKILAVDDDPYILKIAVAVLGCDYEVLTADNGKDAVALAKVHSPAVILLDINMPVMDGLEVLGALAPLPHGMSVVMLTSETDLALVTKALGLGASEYVTKPFDPAALRRLVNSRLPVEGECGEEGGDLPWKVKE